MSFNTKNAFCGFSQIQNGCRVKNEKKNAVHHEICCRIIFLVLQIKKNIFSYMKHCNTGLDGDSELIQIDFLYKNFQVVAKQCYLRQRV
jgi:hypothetical protein